MLNRSISRPLLGAFRDLYPRWVNPEVTSIFIIHEGATCYVEIIGAPRSFAGTLKIMRTNLAIYEKIVHFSTQQSPDVNASLFLHIHPLTIAWTTEIFTLEAFCELSKLTEKGYLGSSGAGSPETVVDARLCEFPNNTARTRRTRANKKDQRASVKKDPRRQTKLPL